MDKVDSRRLGSHLKRLREERKLTLGGVEALSEGFGERINKSYLFRVERGKTVPSIPRLRVLSKVYRVKLSTLLEILETAFEEQEKEHELGKDIAEASYDELRQQGIDSEREGDFSKASLFYRAAWDKALLEPPSQGRSEKTAKLRYDLSVVLKKAGKIELARSYAEDALEEESISTALLDPIRLNLADIYRRLNRLVLSREILDGLVGRSKELSTQLQVGALSLMGSSLLDHDPKSASRYYREALPFTRQTKDYYEECKLLYNIGVAESRSRNYLRSERVLLKAIALAERKDYIFLVSKAKAEIGKAFYLNGQVGEARQYLREAMEVARRRDYYEQLFTCQYYLRRIALDEGNQAKARATESSLRFFASKIEESFDELRSFRSELAVTREESL